MSSFTALELGALVAQAMLCIGTTLLVVRRLAGRLGPSPMGIFTADIVLPLTLLMPFLFGIGPVRASVIGPGWLPIGAPVCMTAIAAGLALWSGGDIRVLRLPAGMSAMLIATALVAMLLAAAHGLTLFVGQLMLVGAFVILWINSLPTTPQDESRASTHTDEDAAIGRAGLLALLCATGAGAASLAAPGELRGASGAIAVGTAVTSLSAIACLSGPRWVLRVGAWIGIVGMLGGVGLLAAAHLTRGLFALWRGEAAVSWHVAQGFGTFALEAAFLFGLPFVPALAAMAGGRSRRVLGACLILSTAVFVAWRLTSV